MRRTQAGFVGAVLALFACSSGRDVVSTDGPDSWSVDPEPQITIGQLEGDPHYLFHRVAGARLLPDGRVVVADRGIGNIRVFGPDGLFQHEMGRTGEGPGEFDYIGDVVVHPPDTIAVYDAGLYRLTKYSAGGTLLATVNLQGEGGRAPELYLGRFENGDLGLASILHVERNPMEPVSDPMQFDRFSPDGVPVAVVGTAPGMVRHGRGPIPFSPYLHSFIYQDSVYYTDGVDVLTVLGDDGSVARTFDLPQVVIDYSDALSQLRGRLETLEGFYSVEQLDAVPPFQSVPDISEALLDDEGRFWFKHYEPETDSNWITAFNWRSGGDWSIVDLDGRVVATIRLPSGFTPMDVVGDRLVGVTRDELEVQRIVVLRIDREHN